MLGFEISISLTESQVSISELNLYIVLFDLVHPKSKLAIILFVPFLTLDKSTTWTTKKVRKGTNLRRPSSSLVKMPQYFQKPENALKRAQGNYFFALIIQRFDIVCVFMSLIIIFCEIVKNRNLFFCDYFSKEMWSWNLVLYIF